MTGKNDLTPKQEAFVLAYLTNGRNGAAAYRSAYDAAKMAQASVDQEVHKLLRHPKIAPRLKAVVDRACQRTEVSVERVLREYARIGFSDIRTFVDFGPSGVILKPDKLLDQDDSAAIAEVSQTPTGGIKFKLHDKKGALDSLARNLGMFVDKVEHNLDDSLATLILGSMKATVK